MLEVLSYPKKWGELFLYLQDCEFGEYILKFLDNGGVVVVGG